MRRYPAFLWLPVYVGSIFVLNGGNPGWGWVQLTIGGVLILAAAAAATYLALGPWPGRPAPKGMHWVFAGVTSFYAICAIAAGAFAGPGAGLATLLAGAVPLTAVAIFVAHARAKTTGSDASRFRDAAAEDHEDPIPGMGFDASRPLGDTPAAHDEIIPEDLPRDHPGRHAVEDQARALGGATPGHAKGGAAGEGGPPPPDEDLVAPEETHEGARFGRDVAPSRPAERRPSSRR